MELNIFYIINCDFSIGKNRFSQKNAIFFVNIIRNASIISLERLFHSSNAKYIHANANPAAVSVRSIRGPKPAIR